MRVRFWLLRQMTIFLCEIMIVSSLQIPLIFSNDSLILRRWRPTFVKVQISVIINLVWRHRIWRCYVIRGRSYWWSLVIIDFTLRFSCARWWRWLVEFVEHRNLIAAINIDYFGIIAFFLSPAAFCILICDNYIGIRNTKRNKNVVKTISRFINCLQSCVSGLPLF